MTDNTSADYDSDHGDAANDNNGRNGDGMSVASREKLRGELNSQVEAFLARGGKIHQVEQDARNDLPQRPKQSYGSRPI